MTIAIARIFHGKIDTNDDSKESQNVNHNELTIQSNKPGSN